MWLREDGTPYYIGKGHGRRAYNKHTRIGHAPSEDRVLVQEFPDECSAFEAEKFLIALYGRKDNGTGILVNLTDGGENPPHSSELGRKARACVKIPGGLFKKGAPPVGDRHAVSLQTWKTRKARGGVAFTLESQRAGGKIVGRLKGSSLGKSGKGLHTRWHVNRGIVKEGCALCR